MSRIADASTPAAFLDHWRAFINRAETLGPEPGVRERWHGGRQRYAVWAFRVDAPQVLQRVRDIQEALGSTVQPKPVSELHMTVWVAGFPCVTARRNDDVEVARLESQRRALESSPWRAPRLVVGGACAFLACAVLEVHDPYGDLAGLRAYLGQFGDEVRFAPFSAHITIAHFGEAQPTAPLVRVLQDYRNPARLALIPQTLELVSFNAHTPASPLETQYAVALEAPGAPLNTHESHF